jgi:hypothetical protein
MVQLVVQMVIQSMVQWVGKSVIQLMVQWVEKREGRNAAEMAIHDSRRLSNNDTLVDMSAAGLMVRAVWMMV